MPNTVPAAATGLPKISRRNVVSALAASSVIAAPALASTAHADAALLVLFEEWKRAEAMQADAITASCDAGDVIEEHNKKLPELARYRDHTVGPGRRQPCDRDWDELLVLTEGAPGGTRRFYDDAYEEMRSAAVHNEWHRDPSRWTSDGSGWLAPYSPALKARVAEILAAYDPWNAECERLKAELDYDAKREASHAATVCLDEIERQIAGTRAVTEAGWRIKAAILFSGWASLAKAREDFQHKLADPDQNTQDLIEDSLAFDLVPDDMGRVQS